MQAVTIRDTDKFSLVSFGRGFAFSFTNKCAARTVFVQGDDASTFDADLDHYEIAFDRTDDALTHLWCDYDSVSVPVIS